MSMKESVAEYIEKKLLLRQKGMLKDERIEFRLCSPNSMDSRNKRVLNKRTPFISTAVSPVSVTHKSQTYFKKIPNNTKKLSQDLQKITIKKHCTNTKAIKVLKVTKAKPTVVKDATMKDVKVLKKSNKMVRSMPDIRKESIKELLSMSKKKLEESELR